MRLRTPGTGQHDIKTLGILEVLRTGMLEGLFVNFGHFWLPLPVCLLGRYFSIF